MCSFAVDFDTQYELSLTEIHQSIKQILNDIRGKHEKVDAVLGDLAYLKRVATDVLVPVNFKVGLSKVTTIGNLKTLLAGCARPSPPNSATRKGRVPTPPTQARPIARAKTDGRINLNEGKCVTLPPVKPKCFSASHCYRPLPSDENANTEAVLLPINVNRAYRTVLHSAIPNKGAGDASDCIPKTQLINARRERRLRRQRDVQSGEFKSEAPDIKHFEMNRFLDDVEREICVLQETFSAFTQRILVPLQTFCKQGNIGEISNNKDFSNADRTSVRQALAKASMDQTEFRIVQTMNQIRQLLWPSDGKGLPTHLFSDEHFSKQVASEIDCNTFPIVRLVPDILQKFNEVITLASMWLKRDILYVQNAKSALQRAHRRFLKTERLWRQARDSQRHLRSEWENIIPELQNNTARLKSVEDDISQLKEDMNKSRGTKRILENKLKNTDDNIDTLRAKHRSLRKRIIVLSTKIEARERSHGFLESRVLSLKADQEAISEKLRISEQYTNNLQNKMEELYGVRDAWSRRYEDKTDPDKLRSRLEQARLRMPLPCLREKTFILKTRMENLSDALDMVEDRLSKNAIHWSALCDELSWPGEAGVKPVRLPDIRGGRMCTDKKLQNDEESSSSPTDSDDSTESTKTFSWRRAFAVSNIKKQVISKYPDDESQQRTMMLQLWLEQNGKNATVENLLQALRASNIPSLADSVERRVT